MYSKYGIVMPGVHCYACIIQQSVRPHRYCIIQGGCVKTTVHKSMLEGEPASAFTGSEY